MSPFPKAAESQKTQFNSKFHQDYCSEFLEACKTSKELGIEIDTLLFPQKPLLNPKHIHNLAGLIHQEAFEFGSQIGFNCFNVNKDRREDVEKICSTTAHLTIGYYTDTELNADLYKFSKNDVFDWVHGRKQATEDMHSWLTLDTGEVIDLTLMSSLGEASRTSELMNVIYVSTPSLPASAGFYLEHNGKEKLCALANNPRFVFHPMVVGEEVFFKIKVSMMLIYEPEPSLPIGTVVFEPEQPSPEKNPPSFLGAMWQRIWSKSKT